MRAIFICAIAVLLAGCATTKAPQRAIDLGMPVFAQQTTDKIEIKAMPNLRLLLDDQGYLRAFAVKEQNNAIEKGQVEESNIK